MTPLTREQDLELQRNAAIKECSEITLRRNETLAMCDQLRQELAQAQAEIARLNVLP